MEICKYPLTLRAILAGISLGLIFTFIGIYLYLKVGIVALGGVFLLGYLILEITGEYDAGENVIILTITGATSLAALGFIDPIASIIIYKDYLSTQMSLSLPLLITLTLSGTILGVFVLYPFYEEFIKLKWPLVTPMAYMIKVLEKEGSKELRYALEGMVFSGITSSLLMASNLYRIDLSGRSSDEMIQGNFTSITVSPLYASLGFFLSYVGYVLLIAGAIYSMIVWSIIEGANPNISIHEHFFNPYIYSVAIPMMITTAILTLAEYSKSIKASLSGLKEESKRAQLTTLLALILLPLVSYIFLSIMGGIPRALVNEVVEVILIAIPIMFISSIFAVRAAGETGFSTSFTLDATLVLTLLLLVPKFESLLLAFAIISVFESMAISLMGRIKFGQIVGVEAKSILKAVIVGGVAGAIIGPSIFWIFHHYQGGIGSSTWPAPFSKLLGGYVLLFYLGIKERRLPSMVSPQLMIFSIILTIVLWALMRKLGLHQISPVLLAIGMIIPPSFLWIASIGAYIDFYLAKRYKKDAMLYKEKRSKWNALLAGVMSGEGIIIFIITIISILPLVTSMLIP